MPFSGKATWSAGDSLPEIAEDVSDLVTLVSPHETPLLDHLGDPRQPATSIVHEWLEDALVPNVDTIDDDDFGNPTSTTAFKVAHPERFRAGDQVRVDESGETMLVTAVSGATLTVVRAYGGGPASAISDGGRLTNLGHAALEGDDAPPPRHTHRARRSNVTQIFTASVEVSGSQLAVNTIGVRDELDYQKVNRLSELLRDLENSVINGKRNAATPQGDASTRRTMRGIVDTLAEQSFTSGSDGFPAGETIDSQPHFLDEHQLNTALRLIWERSSSRVDTLVVNAFQKRRINTFLEGTRRHTAASTRYRDLVDVYESDFGVCRVVMSRWAPRGSVLLLDSTRLAVTPLTGRSFHFKRLAAVGDREAGQIIGEYMLELRNAEAHGVIRGLWSL
jgi:hypothetical protein